VLIDRFELTQPATGAIERIENARSLLDRHLAEPEQWHGVIRRQVLASVVHFSTAIEGNVLTRDQVESIIAGEAIEAPHKDKTEALNYFRAMRWAQTRSQDPSWHLTHETILTLHFMVGTELGKGYEPLGQYRPGQNTVQDRSTGEPIYWPPRPADVPALMSEFVEWVERRSDSSMNPYVLNALAHLNFVALHPFNDGNGRVCRLLCSLLMMRQGYKAQAFWSLEEYFGRHAVRYGNLLRDTLGPRWMPDRVVATAWVEWYLDAIATQVTEASALLEHSMATFTAVLAGVRFTVSQALESHSIQRLVVPVWLAATGGSVTRRQLIRYADVTEETLSRDLRRLVSLGLLAPRGKGRGSHYVPGPALLGWGPFDDLVRTATGGDATAVLELLETRSRPTLF
jgi:Fic family protein